MSRREKLDFVLKITGAATDAAKVLGPLLSKWMDRDREKTEAKRQNDQIILIPQNPDVADQLRDVIKSNNQVVIERSKQE